MSSDADREMLATYDRSAAEWVAAREPTGLEAAVELQRRIGGGRVLDLGCGPGWHLDAFDDGSVGLDASLPMLRIARERRPTNPMVGGRFEALPFADGSFTGLWASKSLIHLARPDVPMALAEVHRVLEPDGVATLVMMLQAGREADPAGEHHVDDDEGFGRRWFSFWEPDHLRRVIEGAGFAIESWIEPPELRRTIVTIRRLHSLPDYVGPGMGLLICGLNPSPASADSGVGYFRAGNRFWPAALAAGLVSVDRSPRRALAKHNMGMTDLVKRTTRRADELGREEYDDGVERVRALVEWLQPEAVCMVGLAGWRSAVDRHADRGWQPGRFGGRPVYVMPSTSGLNAHETKDSLTVHLRTAAAGP